MKLYFAKQTSDGITLISKDDTYFVPLSGTSVEIAKNRNQIVVRTPKFIGTKTETYDVKDISRIELREEKKMLKINSRSLAPRGSAVVALVRLAFDKPQQVTFSKSVIVFKDGRELFLTGARSYAGGILDGAILFNGSTTGIVSIASQIASFLGVPFEEKKSIS
jgi:hypothetical protein